MLVDGAQDGGRVNNTQTHRSFSLFMTKRKEEEKKKKKKEYCHRQSEKIKRPYNLWHFSLKLPKYYN